MATIRTISKKERKAEKRARFRIVCAGVTKDDFASIFNTFQKQFDCKVALRNPFPPEFSPKAVHEIIAHVTGSAVGGYAAKKAIDAAKDLFRRLHQVQIHEKRQEARRTAYIAVWPR